jgi:hypothetical protein
MYIVFIILLYSFVKGLVENANSIQFDRIVGYVLVKFRIEWTISTCIQWPTEYRTAVGIRIQSYASPEHLIAGPTKNRTIMSVASLVRFIKKRVMNKIFFMPKRSRLQSKMSGFQNQKPDKKSGFRMVKTKWRPNYSRHLAFSIRISDGSVFGGLLYLGNIFTEIFANPGSVIKVKLICHLISP